MRRTYKQIIEDLKAVEVQDPQRFRRFYDAAWLRLKALKPGQRIEIDKVCAENARELFRSIIEAIIEEMEHLKETDAILQLSEEDKFVERLYPIKKKDKLKFKINE